MFKSAVLIPAYKTLLGWRQHFDLTEITLDPDLLVSDSGEYYQDSNAALRLDYINTTLSPNQDINDYLREKVESGIVGMLNDLVQRRLSLEYGKTLLEQTQLLNRHSWISDTITNQNRFVGFQIYLRSLEGLQMVINEIGVQLDGGQDLTLYLFNSQKKEAIATIDITVEGVSWTWKNANQELNSFKSESYNGGVFILGYYQEDLTTSAINYSNFDWNAGECGTCSNTRDLYRKWVSVNQYFYIRPIYWANGNFVKEEMPNLEDAFYPVDTSFGLNLRLSVRCDLTEFLRVNRFAFKNLLALRVSLLILKDMSFSQQTNFVEENLKMMIIRDLEGDKETNALNLSQQYDRELKAVSFNLEGINGVCLPCNDSGPSIGVV